jgi:hypothetical protein
VFERIQGQKQINQESKRLLMLTSLFIHHTPSEITNLAEYFGMTKKQRNDILDTKLLLNLLKESPSKLPNIIKRYSDQARMLAYLITYDQSLLPYIKVQ